MSTIQHRDAGTGQAIPGHSLPDMHTITHVDTATASAMASAFRRPPLTEGRAAPPSTDR